MFTLRNLLFVLLSVGSISANSAIIDINLNTFYQDPSVQVNFNGTIADLQEDPSLSTVLLSIDPFFGDPGIPVPANTSTINFTYDFFVSTNNV